MYLSLHWRILSFELRGSHDATTRTNTRYFGWWELISSIISSCMRAEYFCCSVRIDVTGRRLPVRIEINFWFGSQNSDAIVRRRPCLDIARNLRSFYEEFVPYR